MTLPEAAAYLRVSEADVVRMLSEHGLPGRKIGAEWRFALSALQSWLSMPAASASQRAMMAMAGAFKDDPYLEEIAREAYQQRGRSMTEDKE